MLGGAILILGSTTFLFCFLLPLILPLIPLVAKEAKDEDRSSLDIVNLVFLENIGSWWTQQQEKRRK